MKNILLFGFSLLFSTTSLGQVELISNGSFETGDSSSWEISTVNGNDTGPGTCSENWRIESDSSTICLGVSDFAPTDGVFGAFTSFDSGADNTQWILEQTVSLPPTVVAAEFSFDFRAEFNFATGSPPGIPRELRIDFYRLDGTPYSNIFIEQYISASELSIFRSETEEVSARIAGLEGQDVTIRVTAFVPEFFRGPSKAMIDNISFVVDDGLNVADFTLANALRVSPNPSNGTFTLNYEGAEALQSAAIYDMTGKHLARFNLEAGAVQQTLTANLPRGMYLLRVDSQSSSTTEKLLIE